MLRQLISYPKNMFRSLDLRSQISKRIMWIISKSHREKNFCLIFLQSIHQLDMKNVVKWWKDFLLYFTILETYPGISTLQLWYIRFLPVWSVQAHKPVSTSSAKQATGTKGQLISECPFGRKISSKIPTKLLPNFCHEIFCSFLGASWKLLGASCRLPCL